MFFKNCFQNILIKNQIEYLCPENSTECIEFVENITCTNCLDMLLSNIPKELNTKKETEHDNFDFLMEPEPVYEISDIHEWEPKDFKMETTTIWSFKDRGKWATHSGKYRGNWSPYIPRNLILRYSKEGDLVLDPFLGSGTTLVETKLLKRRGIGIDINPESNKIARENIRFNRNNEYEPKIYNLDSRNLNFLSSESVDLICAHPPYANIIKYSENIEGDLSIKDIDDFLPEISLVAKELFRVLKKYKYCALLIGDIRRNKHMVPLGFYVMQEFLKVGFVLKENIIKEQHNCQATSFWYQKSIDYNFLLIAHEYLFIFRKP